MFFQNLLAGEGAIAIGAIPHGISSSRKLIWKIGNRFWNLSSAQVAWNGNLNGRVEHEPLKYSAYYYGHNPNDGRRTLEGGA